MGRLFTYMVKAATGEQPVPYTEGRYQAWLRDGAGFDSKYYHPDMEQRIFDDEKKYAQHFITSYGGSALSLMPYFQRAVANVRNQQRSRGATYIKNTLSQGGTLQPWAVDHLQKGYGITNDLLKDKTFQKYISEVNADNQSDVANAFRAMDITWNPKTSDYRDPAFIKALQEGIRAGKWKPTASASTGTPGTTLAPRPATGQSAVPVQAPGQSTTPQPAPAPARAAAPTVKPRGTFNAPAAAPPMQVSFYNLPAGMSQEEAIQKWNTTGNPRVRSYLNTVGRQGAKNIQVSPDGSTIRFMHSNGGFTETDTPPSTLRRTVTNRPTVKPTNKNMGRPRI